MINAYDVMPTERERDLSGFDLVITTNLWVPISQQIALDILMNKRGLLGDGGVSDNRFNIKCDGNEYPIINNMISIDLPSSDEFQLILYEGDEQLATTVIINRWNSKTISIYFKAVVV